MRTTRMWRARRLVWRVRRSGPRLARPASRLLSAAEPPAAPIVVLGCPRSGTSVLLQALLRSPELRSVQTEGHILWDEFHHPRDRGWDSDELGAVDVEEREREYVYRAIRWWTRGRRFVDKTPESCLRVGYLAALFPDARFVFLCRRAADNVSSLMEGWRARPRFVKYTLPTPLRGIAPLDGERWSFVLVPGWRELRDAPLEEICAHQYLACNGAVLDARERMDQSRWVGLAYESLVASPVGELRRVYEELELAFTPEAEAFARSLVDRPAATTLTTPRPEKWRDQNREAIERVLPGLVALEQRLGYADSPGDSAT